MAPPDRKHRVYSMPARNNGFVEVMLPCPCHPDDLNILRKWIDMFEEVLTDDQTKRAPEPEKDEGPQCPTA